MALSVDELDTTERRTSGSDGRMEGTISKEESIFETPLRDPLADIPDGGLRAWLVILGTFFITFSTFGYVNAWGIFQSYYAQNQLKAHSQSQIAWIGSIQYAFIFLPGVFTGRLFDLGHLRVPLFASSVLLVVATFLVAECTKYWHFVLCQGVALGLACGILFGPTLGVVGQWFRRNRGIAFGFTATGTCIGGTVFPIFARNMIDRVGFPWTMRSIGFILIFALAFPNLLIRRRIPPPKIVTGSLLSFRSFRLPAYSVYAAGAFTSFMGIYTVLTYIDVAAVENGISADFSFYLVAIANASNLCGRLLNGILVDKFGTTYSALVFDVQLIGAVNAIAPVHFFAGVLTYAWPFALDRGSLITIAVLYGLTSGAYVSSFLLPLFELGGDMSDIGQRTGMMMNFAAAGALVGPVKDLPGRSVAAVAPIYSIFSYIRLPVYMV